MASADVATANAKATAINLIIVFSMSSIQVEISLKAATGAGYATSEPCLCASFAVTGEVTGNCSTVAC